MTDYSQKNGLFREYRQLIIAVALFIVLDVFVLSLNFYMSKTLRQDASWVANAASLQTISQQLLLDTFQLQKILEQESQAKLVLQKLQNNYQQFELLLQQIIEHLQSQPEPLLAAKKVEVLWQGFKTHLFPVVNVPEPMASDWFKRDLQQATVYLLANNDAMLLANENLLGSIKAGADTTLHLLRWVQLGAIALALANFLFVVFHFIARLKMHDQHLLVAKQNTEQILDFVNDGLLLLTPELTISGQYSKRCLQIFSADDIAGMHFTELLQNKISEKEMHSVNKYLHLLFDHNAKETLLEELNPLRKIRLLVSNDKGDFIQRYISFAFKRTIVERGVAHVLVTIADKSEVADLENQLQLAKQSHSGQLDVLNAILAIDKQEFFLFVQESIERLHKVNAILQQPSRRQEQFEKQVHKIVIELHKLKGEASMLALHELAKDAHTMEQISLDLLHLESINGSAFLPLAVKLKVMLRQFDQFQNIASQLNRVAQIKPDSEESLSIINEKSLNNLVQSIAQKQHKKIQLQLLQKGKEHVPQAMLQAVKDIVVQLVRNAASHGIERCEDRALKPDVGKIQVRIHVDQKILQVIVRDDGQGIDLQAVKEKALACGRVRPENLKSMTEQEGFALLFEPGFSTAVNGDIDSGRGMGMLAVKKMLQKLGGRIAIAQACGEYCQFTVRLPLKDSPSLLEAY